MDPIVAISIINDTKAASRAYRGSVLEALAEWIGRGGFPPLDSPNLTDEACESLRSEGLDQLALAVRVAIAYDDRSGLEA
jgi:hypothetical protein